MPVTLFGGWTLAPACAYCGQHCFQVSRGEAYSVKSKPLAWAILRPLLIAVAAAASWIVFSAAGASADSSTSSDSPLATGASTLSSVTTTVTRQAKDLLEPVEPGPGGGLSNAPASIVPTLVPAPSLRPVAEEVEGLAENAVETVPVVNLVV